MKKILALALALSMSCSLVACSSTTETTTTTDTAATTTTTTTDTTSDAADVEEVAFEFDSDMSFIVPNAAGGGNDLTTRAMIPALEEDLGITVVPLNQGESAGAVAANTLMTAEADGTTLYFNSQTLVTTALTTVTSIDLDMFQPVAQVAEDTGIVLVQYGRWETFEEFEAAAQSETLLVATNGDTALWGIATSKLADAMGVEFDCITYDSGPSMMTAVAAGEVDMCIVNPAEAASMIDAEKIVALAVMSDSRLSNMTDLPTCIECGVDVTYAVWRGVFTTAGTSEEILNRLDEAFAMVMEDESFLEYMDNAGLPVCYRDHNEFTAFIEEEIAFYTAELAS